jgi:hypothetical protein
MAGKQVQRRRGSTAQHAVFTGAIGEITVDTDKKTAVVHDGVTAGGFPLARKSDSDTAAAAAAAAQTTADTAITTANAAVTTANTANTTANTANTTANTAQTTANTGVANAATAQSGVNALNTNAYQRSNILGTVSQSGGVPTGALIETGSNANGSYTKWADGTLICERRGSVSVDLTTATGGLWTNSGEFLLSAPFPAAFVSAPVWVVCRVEPYHCNQLAGAQADLHRERGRRHAYLLHHRERKVVLMRIKLSPQRREDVLDVVKAGNVLYVNGEAFDFTPMGDGDTLPSAAITSVWFVGDVDQEGGELTLTLLLPLPWNYSPEQAFPADLVDVPDGPVVFPQPLPIDESLPSEGELPA